MGVTSPCCPKSVKSTKKCSRIFVLCASPPFNRPIDIDIIFFSGNLVGALPHSHSGSNWVVSWPCLNRLGAEGSWKTFGHSFLHLRLVLLHHSPLCPGVKVISKFHNYVPFLSNFVHFGQLSLMFYMIRATMSANLGQFWTTNILFFCNYSPPIHSNMSSGMPRFWHWRRPAERLPSPLVCMTISHKISEAICERGLFASFNLTQNIPKREGLFCFKKSK